MNLSVHDVELRTDSAPVVVYCWNWREILAALGLPYDVEHRRRIRAANKRFGGPIFLPGKGGQPKVAKTALLTWYNGLEKRFCRLQARERDAQATVHASHQYGRDAVVIPDIAGHVKKRRESCKSIENLP